MQHRLKCTEFAVVVKDRHNISSLNLRQHISKQFVVMFHAVIKVDLDVLVGKVVNLFLVFLQLGRLILELLLLFGQLHALGCTGMVNSITELGKLGAVTLLLLMYIVRAQTGEKIALIAVHIAQCLEAVLLAAVKEPVDWTLLIGFQMVGIEVIQEVAADHLAGRTLAAECIGDKLEVFFQRVITICSTSNFIYANNF